jgi:cysteine desulfurase
MPVYLDHNATTPLDERVLEAMLPFLRGRFGNASSLHRYGRLARGAVERAREQVAALVGTHPSRVVFTGGGSEANNLALKGIGGEGRTLLSAVEHPSVREPARSLGRWIELPVDRQGRLAPETLADRLRAEDRLVSVMWANNETGVLQDIPALAERCRERGVPLHSDAVQAAGKVPLDFDGSGVRLMSLSAHKLYGPQGVGALVVDKTLEPVALLHGGGQEKGLRGGTENVAGIVGFGAAAELVLAGLAEEGVRLLALRRRLEEGLAALGIEMFAREVERLPNTVMFGLAGIDGETLLMQLDRKGIAVSSGSACASGKTEPSPVLAAMGVAPELARGAVRVSLGRASSEADVDALLTGLSALTTNLFFRAANA